MEKVRPFNKSNPEVAIFSESIRALLKSRARYSAWGATSKQESSLLC